MRNLLLPKLYVILTFVITFLLAAAYAFNYIINSSEKACSAVCNLFHIASPEEFKFGYALTAGIAAVVILIVFGYMVQNEFFTNTSSLDAGGSLIFVVIFYMVKLFLMILFGALCLCIFFILSLYTVIFKIIVHEPLDD